MDKRQLIYFLSTLFFVFSTFSLRAEVLPIETFIKHGDYLDIKISPDGKHLAGRLRGKDGVALIFINIEQGKIVGGTRAFGGGDIHSVAWVSDERVIYEIAERRPGHDSKFSTGELFGINIDNSKAKYLYGYRAGDKRTGSRLFTKDDNYSSLEVLNVLPKDKKHILIIEYPWEQQGNYWYDRRSRSAIISKLNIYSGKKKKIEFIPYNNVSALADDNGNVNFIRWQTKDNKFLSAYRKKNKQEWQMLSQSLGIDDDIKPVAISRDSTKAYFEVAEGDAGLTNVYELDFAEGGLVKVFNNTESNINNWIYDPHSLKPVVGVAYPDKTQYYYTDSDSNVVKNHKKLVKAFKGQDIFFTSRTRDGKLILVRVESDINPGEYYLYNTESKKAQLAWINKSWVDPRLMRPVKHIAFNARDGIKIKGFLTLPEVKGGKKSPLVVLVHGGPHGIRDYWQYDDEVQLLANRGYAVLQINFRGSGGYGNKFEDMGNRQWGSGIINDILDGTQYIFKTEAIDANRACIFGASYGGYASLMAAVREPDTFKCSIGYVGIYDLELMYSKGDIPDLWGGEAYLQKVLGHDQQQLREFSPVNYADQIKAAVMLIHGEEDLRAPLIHAKKMRKALKRAGKEPKWLLYGDSGHGVWSMRNRKDLYSRLIKFLDKHIGQDVAIPAAKAQ
ncbi:alpha/beta hydrolase family protein [Agarilytica rhodophyticola]|uniref:alpha/beta hydrolase family protein n=1 Tax=Agarilytica rhodophyticola TaxID=1737490 RepID=UPI000B34575A|nr:S9 family peptidase [Agarilytica rhodophyticola]